jgi:hypothetical protein
MSQFAVVDGELGQRNDVRALAPAADGALWVGTFGGGLTRHLLPLIIDLQSMAPTEAILNLIVPPEARPPAAPACWLPAAPMTVVVSGATLMAMPRPSTAIAGKNVVQ